MRENCLYNNAIKIVLEKAKEYVSNIKEEVNNIIFYVNENLLLKSEFDFYRKVLTQNGFKTNDDIEYKYELN